MFRFGRQGQNKPQTLGEALAGFRRKSFEVIANKRPDGAHFGKMSPDLERPTVKRSFAFPQQFLVAMDMPAIDIVFGRIIAKQPQIEKVGRAWQEFERGKISFVKWSGVRPDPANTMLFQKPNELWPMPAGVTKFNREAELPWQLADKIAQRQFALLWRERRGKLDQDNIEFRSKRFDGVQKRI